MVKVCHHIFFWYCIHWLIFAAELPKQFTIAGWPTYYDSVKAALTLMEKTHCVNYLQAFDMHGRLIQPSEYRKVLQGTLIQMHFTMTHWYIRPKGQQHMSDVFVADIYSMCVFTPPKAIGPVTHRKRKFGNMDLMMPDISPKKFRKTPWSRLLFFCTHEAIHGRPWPI